MRIRLYLELNSLNIDWNKKCTGHVMCSLYFR